MFACATVPLRSARTQPKARRPVSLPRGNLIGLYVDHAKAAQFPCIFRFWCISTNRTGLWCCSLGYPVLHQGRAALGVAFERTPIKWKTRMPDRTRCAESDAFYIHVRYYLNLHIVRIEPTWRGNEPKATPYAQERHEGENPSWEGEGIFPPPLRKATLSFHFLLPAGWVDSCPSWLIRARRRWGIKTLLFLTRRARREEEEDGKILIGHLKQERG